MSHNFDEFSGKPLGQGKITGAGSLNSATLGALLTNYKKTVASNYRSVLAEEINDKLPPGKLVVSPKIDGELWYLMTDGDEPLLISPNGRVISGDLPLLNEYKETGNFGKADTETPQLFISFSTLTFSKSFLANIGREGLYKMVSAFDDHTAFC